LDSEDGVSHAGNSETALASFEVSGGPRATDSSVATKAVLWIAKIFFVSYLGWVLNVTLDGRSAMVLWHFSE